MDKKDRRILYQLDYNARKSLTSLGDAVGLSKQTCRYRLDQLEDNEVITGYHTVVNMHSLGFMTYRLYLRYENIEKESTIISYFQDRDSIVWFASLLGSWDLEVVFAAPNTVVMGNIIKDIKADLGEHLHTMSFSASTVNYHLDREYLVEDTASQTKPRYYGFEPSQVDLDELDIQLLETMATNCRRSNTAIGQELDVSYHTVSNRVERLADQDVIADHRIGIDINKLDRLHYKVLLQLAESPAEQQLYNYCNKIEPITFIIDVLGEWDFEIEAEVRSQRELNDILRKIRNNFSSLIESYEILQAPIVHHLDYFPPAVSDTLKATT